MHSTVPRGAFYGVAAVLVAMVLISSTVAVVYYYQYQQLASQSKEYSSELDAALTRYRSLASSFNSSLQDYNVTLTLLVAAVAHLNTSNPPYMKPRLAPSSLLGSLPSPASLSGRKVPVYAVHMLVDYGNGTRHWYNDTAAQPGWNAFVASLVLLDGKVQATWYPQFGEHFITGLNGVSGNASESWFVWEHDSAGWTASQAGADELMVGNGTVMAWTLCPYDVNFSPSCIP